jgi:preprotein translocase subunit SecA
MVAAAGAGAAPDVDAAAAAARALPEPRPAPQPPAAAERALASEAPVDPSSIPVVGRNEPCPCGSGVKYRQCHGKKPEATA